MSEVDLVVLNGTVVTAHSHRKAEVSVLGGKIAGIHEPGRHPKARHQVDAEGMWVMPGFVDAHFHCRAPDHPEREDFRSGTSAAAAGGVTTVLEMPVADFGTSTVERFRSRRAIAERDSLVDVGLFAGCATLSESMITALAAEGAVGFKLFTHSPHADRIDAFDGLWLTGNAEILQALTLVSATHLPVAIHAEDEGLLNYYATVSGHDRSPAKAYLDSRPAVVEAMAIARVCILAEATGARIHIVHVSSRWAADIVNSWRERGASVTAETCPHYMFFTSADMDRVGNWAKVAPPLRSDDDTEALLDALADGHLQAICSDHAPFARTDREGVGFQAAPSGVPSVEIFAQMALEAGLSGRVPLPVVVRALTEGPASIYGLYPRKGSLDAGADADFVVYNPDVQRVIRTGQWHSRARESAKLFEGRKLRGRVEQTYVRGTLVYTCGEVVGAPGYGRVVRPDYEVHDDGLGQPTHGIVEDGYGR